MGFQLLLASSTTLMLLWPVFFNLAEAASIALPGCTNLCGNISIPYPFGIESGCYLEDSFKINCSSNGTPTVFPGLEVLRISVEDWTVDVKSSVSSTCDENGKSNNATDVGIMNLESTQFVISSTRNKFTAVGCNNLALLSQGDSTVGGCMSICMEDEVYTGRNGSCTGINCCQGTIPDSLKVLNISITTELTCKSIGASSKACKYAYLVNQSWFEEVGVFSKVLEMGYSPVVLDWTVDFNTYTPVLFNRSKELRSDGWRAASCISNSTEFGYTVVRCSCSQGAEGNPYLPNGCTDIDECSLYDPYVCDSRPDLCLNLDGGFTCLPPKKKSLVRIGLGIGIGALFGLLLVLTGIWTLSKVWRKRRNRKLREKFFRRNGGLLLQEQLLSGEVNVEKVKMFSSKELDKAIDHFNINRMLGQGGQGTVYKGMLADGRIVAVKVSKAGLEEGKIREFINEVVGVCLKS